MSEAVPSRLPTWLLPALVAAAWVAGEAAVWWDAPSNDLTSVYLGARLLDEGLGDHLYAHDPVLFVRVDDAEWARVAAATDVGPVYHPYVHIPLVAAAAVPAATRLSFGTMSRVMLLANLLAMALAVWLAGCLYCPSLNRWWAYALSLGVLGLSIPGQFSLSLAQTTPLILAAVVAALWWMKRGRDLPAAQVPDTLGKVVAALPATPPTVRQFLTQRLRAAGGITWAAIGDGFALPHLSARVTLGRDSGTVALLLLRDALTQASPTPDNVPVTRMFFFIAPSPRAHLDLIGRLTRALAKGTLRDVIVKGASDADILAAAAAADAATTNGNKTEVKR